MSKIDEIIADSMVTHHKYIFKRNDNTIAQIIIIIIILATETKTQNLTQHRLKW